MCADIFTKFFVKKEKWDHALNLIGHCDLKDIWGVSAASAAPIWQDTIASKSSQNSVHAANKLRTLLRRAERRATTKIHTSPKTMRLWARYLNEKDNIVWPRFVRQKHVQAYVTHFELDNDWHAT